MVCDICGVSPKGDFGKPRGVETTYTLCLPCYKQWRKSYERFRSHYRSEHLTDPYEDEELIEGETYPAPCFLCGTLKNHSDFEPYSQYYKCPDCLRVVKQFCDDWVRKNRIQPREVPKFEPLPLPPIGDPSCEHCKKCSCYQTCFSRMKGFPDSSSNFGRSQANCASHHDGCGIKHYEHQATLSEFYDHCVSMETSKEVN